MNPNATAATGPLFVSFAPSTLSGFVTSRLFSHAVGCDVGRTNPHPCSSRIFDPQGADEGRRSSRPILPVMLV